MARNDNIALKGQLWMTVGDQNLGGPGRIELLARIAEHGSITQAAKSMKMSYKAAWDAIDHMNNLARQPLVERMAGGKGGGSTRLTARGERLVASFRLIERAHRRFVDQLSKEAGGLEEDLLVIGRMSMRTSARNQFLGTVKNIRTGAVNDEIELEIVGAQKIIAIITHESTVNLGLEVGSEAFALVKAPSVIIMTEDGGARLSARNRLAGTVSRVQVGAVNAEVVIDLPGGGAIAAIVTNESASNLALTVGGKATAVFKASSVIIGVAA